MDFTNFKLFYPVLKNLTPRDSVWMMVPLLLQMHLQMRRPALLHTTTTGTRCVYLSWFLFFLFVRHTNRISVHVQVTLVLACLGDVGDQVTSFSSSLFSNNTAAGDRTPGASTTSTPSITSTTLLLPHDGPDRDMKTETWRTASFLTCRDR